MSAGKSALNGNGNWKDGEPAPKTLRKAFLSMPYSSKNGRLLVKAEGESGTSPKDRECEQYDGSMLYGGTCTLQSTDRQILEKRWDPLRWEACPHI